MEPHSQIGTFGSHVMNVWRSQFARKTGSSLSVCLRTSATICARTSGSTEREMIFSSRKASVRGPGVLLRVAEAGRFACFPLTRFTIGVLAVPDVPLLVGDRLPDPRDVLVELQHELAAHVRVLRLRRELHQRQKHTQR